MVDGVPSKVQRSSTRSLLTPFVEDVRRDELPSGVKGTLGFALFTPESWGL